MMERDSLASLGENLESPDLAYLLMDKFYLKSGQYNKLEIFLKLSRCGGIVGKNVQYVPFQLLFLFIPKALADTPYIEPLRV